jgi:hypothetical protein
MKSEKYLITFHKYTQSDTTKIVTLDELEEMISGGCCIITYIYKIS